MIDMDPRQSIVFTYVIADLACFLFMFPILRKVKTSVGSEMEAKLFMTMVATLLVHIVTDAGMIFFRQITTNTPYALNCFIVIINELSLVMVSFFWFLFANVRLKVRLIDKKWYRIVVSLPCVFDIFMVVISPLTKWIFYFDENGLFQRGRIYMLQALTILVYILLTSMLATRRAVTQKTAFEKQNCLSLIFFIIPPAIASVVQQFNHNAPITVMGLSIAVYYVYLNMLDSQVYNDSLTGLNNRRRARYYLLDSLELADTKPFVVFMIDVDYFKTINDKYGHSEGDRALCVVADSLKDTADQYDGFAARMGGDEFLLSMNYTPGVVPEHMTLTPFSVICRIISERTIFHMN